MEAHFAKYWLVKTRVKIDKSIWSIKLRVDSKTSRGDLKMIEWTNSKRFRDKVKTCSWPWVLTTTLKCNET